MSIIFYPLQSFSDNIDANFPGIYIWGIMQPTQYEINSIYERVQADFETGDCFNGKYLNLFSSLSDKILFDRKFLPLFVGETKKGYITNSINLYNKRMAHAMPVWFDLSLPPTIMYNGIQNYNINWLRKNYSVRLSMHFRNLNKYVNKVPGYFSMIFHNSPYFISEIIPDIKLPEPENWIHLQNVNINDLIMKLVPLNKHSQYLNELMIKLLVSQVILKRYFKFTCINAPVNINLYDLKAATKFTLEKMGIFTISEAHSIAYRQLLAGIFPLNKTIDFDTHLRNVIFNPNNVNPLIFPV